MNEWRNLDQNLIGNILLLIGELIRSQKFESLLGHSENICQICLEIIQFCNKGVVNVDDSTYESMSETIEPKTPEKPANKEKRISTMGLEKVGDSNFLLCALSCLQRLMDSSPEVFLLYAFKKFLI